MLRISRDVAIPSREIELTAVRARGAGGQNVNKVSSAIHLRFDIMASSLPAVYKRRLLELKDRRISGDGVIVIKAQQARSQDVNRAAALARLQALIRGVTIEPKKRRPTRPTRASRLRRLAHKSHHGRLKRMRGRVRDGDE